MNTHFTFDCHTVAETQALAAIIGAVVEGGDVIEFVSDLGGGKTTFIKGLAKAMGVEDLVQSPTFTISQLHNAAHGLELHHFDFYRLTEPGVMRAELAESLAQPRVVTVIEWGEIMHDILPKNRTTIKLTVPQGETRVIEISCPQGHIAKALLNYRESRPVT